MSDSETTNEGGEAIPQERKAGRRLPPPAFPPGGGGARRGMTREARPGDLSDGMISPPSDPRPLRASQEGDEELPARIDPRDVRVTGMGDEERLERTKVPLAEDPPVLEVVEMVGRLARALRHQGKAALQVTPEMSPFEATLRAYCVGYIAGRRGEEEQV